MPDGKHIFGIVSLSEKGQIVIPKKAREVFGLKAGDQLLVMGDESQGLALVKASLLQSFAADILNAMQKGPVDE